MDLLLDAWRSVSEHLDIEESCVAISKLLSKDLDHLTLVVRSLNFQQRLLETTGLASNGEESQWNASNTLLEQQLDRLVRWCSEHSVVSLKNSANHPAEAALPEQLEGDVLVGPLFAGEQLVGLALLYANPNQLFTEQDIHRFHQFLAPLAAAVRNDHRLGELERLRNAMEADNQALLKRLGRQDITDAIIGADDGLKDVLERVAQVGPTDVPVLLLGETGSGKEVIARAIHRASKRSDGPLLTVNCGAIPPGLVDSELFGHERGSFTGALGAHKGWFERAEGGTLFLDEVGELPTSVQVRLLRVLQDGLITRVGGQASIRVNVRVVAATHQNLQAMVEGGKFREDLWYRLSIFPIYLPALRERKKDIPALATHFAHRAGMRMGGHPLLVSNADIAILMNYEWPGNVRELNAVIERAAILGNGHQLFIKRALGGKEANGGSLHEEMVGDSIIGLTHDQTHVAAESPLSHREIHDSDSAKIPLASLDEMVKKHIIQALTLSHGVVEGPYGAATLLQVNPHTLRSKMRKHGIDWKKYKGIGFPVQE